MTDLTNAWQAALAAQQQAVFGYGLLGPHLAGADQPRAMTEQAAHESSRDAIAAAMSSAGVTPGNAAADYPGLYPVDNPSQALALAARLEDDCAVAWRVLYAAASATAGANARRGDAQTGLTASAVSGARWRKIANVTPASRAFPGL